MNNNALGIVGIIAGSVVALAGIAGIAFQKNRASEPQKISSAGDGRSENKYGIIFQMLDDEWKKITDNDVLKNESTIYTGVSRSKLYRVRHFKPPEAGKPREVSDFDGGLPEDQLLFTEEVMIKKIPDEFLGYAFQIGIGGKDIYEKYGFEKVSMPQGRGRADMRESKEMVDEVNAILAPPK